MKKFANTIWKMTAQLILVALIIFFAIQVQGVFFTTTNLISIVRQVPTMGIAALGIPFLMITGNLDFSTGAIYAFVGTFSAFLHLQGVNIYMAMLISVLLGIIIFCVTCWISITFNISRLVVSMAMNTTI